MSLQALTGTSHLPLTQLSEQQAVLPPHGWWKAAQVEQLTPAKQVEVPKQQPPTHEAAVHWQVADVPLPTHTRPGPHAGEVPHLHVPVDVSQRLVVLEAQVPQVLPPLPQLVSFSFASATQLEPPALQQPVQPTQPLQTPPVQPWPDAAQLLQAPPFLPHALALVGPLVTHAPFAPPLKSQQSLAPPHELAVHLH
jgi:hypothetical protein